MLFLKWIILIAIFVTTTTLGYAYGDKYSKRVYYLRELLQSIKQLKTEVIILSNPLPIALENVSKKSIKNINSIYNLILQEIISKDGEDVYASFLLTKDLLRNECLLKTEDINLFLNLGKVIGKTNRLDQDKHFTHAIEELNLVISEAKVEKNKNQKMYRSLGLLMGLGAIIILI